MLEPLVIQLPPQTRAFALERGQTDAEKRSVSLSFSSENPVQRTFPADFPDKRLAGKRALEVLDHSDGACDLSRLRAFLVDHDPKQQIGTVERPGIKDRRGMATARFSRSPQGQKEFDDVQDGIRSEISTGYRIQQYRLEPTPGNSDVPTMRVTKWQPYEVSLLALAADPTVGIGRSAPVDSHALADCLVERAEEPDGTEITRAAGANQTITTSDRPAMTEAEKAAQDAKDRETIRKDEIKRGNEIRSIADKLVERGFKAAAELATAAIADGTGIEDFRAQALEKLFAAKPLNLSPEIGMNEKEKSRYSLLRAVRSRIDSKPLDGLELECSRAVEKQVGTAPEGFYIPHDVTADAKRDLDGRRDLQANVFGSGGATVQTDVLGGSMIELLRNKQLIRKLGARSMDGLVGNAAIPRQTGAATGYSVSEIGSLTGSTQALGQLALTPHRIGAFNNYSKQLLAQSSIDVENFVRQDLMIVLAILSDYLAINGLGSANQPQGILNTSGVGEVTFGGAPTWASIVEFETVVANANADFGSLAYLTTPNARGVLKQTAKIGNTYPVFLWDGKDANGFGEMNTYPAAATLQVPGDLMIFGNFADVIIAGWAGMDVVVDPYTMAATGEVRITINQFMDVGLRHAASFAVSEDSAAQ